MNDFDFVILHLVELPNWDILCRYQVKIIRCLRMERSVFRIFYLSDKATVFAFWGRSIQELRRNTDNRKRSVPEHLKKDIKFHRKLQYDGKRSH
jgi:hypothetical protein